MGNALKGYRCRLGENQEEFARNIGMSFSTYCKKEQGCYSFKASEMASIRDYLKRFFPDITVDEIFFNQY